MLLIVAGLLIYSAAQTPPGIYQVAPVNGAIIRMDTRTGTMERCTVGSVVVCESVKEAGK